MTVHDALIAEATSPAQEDIEALATLLAEGSEVRFRLRTDDSQTGNGHHLHVFKGGQALRLTEILPLVTCLGVDVIDERPFAVTFQDGGGGWVYDLRVDVPGRDTLGTAVIDDLTQTLQLLWEGQLEPDSFNRLNLPLGITWAQVNVIRAYGRYLQQLGAPFSNEFLVQALLDHPESARRLVALFASRFDPADTERADSGSDNASASFADALQGIPNLAQEEAVRAVGAAVLATARTNAYRPTRDGSPRVSLAFKVDPAHLPFVRGRQARWETWVHSSRVEGIHIRFGAVSRGGIRWSQRTDDFRTEVLQLVSAQLVKNAVIVPTGAKGGFIAKAGRSIGGPDAHTEGVEAYKEFIRGLLDITDNYVTIDGKRAVQPPPHVARLDADDPYLVVAADKGTATFSDAANEVAREYGFWLGDAFASGGSHGFDHKAMGITARGAWEAVRHHLKEIRKNPAVDPVTAVGIGDMSGDVFGNGMLLSRHLRLVAAFDHRHVFLDPAPDPEASFVERERLYAMPRSSWADYRADLISSGGGVFSRSDKSIPISPEIAAALGLVDAPAAMEPNAVIRALLTAPVDVLWNGGIGTYVKASTEANADARDKVNDGVRVDASQLRAAVVAEGGNLGLTQHARLEYAARGGRCNNDAIDNSAGVDTSDHEVNIKILLDHAVDTGQKTREERNSVLRDTTEVVARQVLRNNREQNVLIGVSQRFGASMAASSSRLIDDLEASGRLDRDRDALPTAQELDDRRNVTGAGLSRPEIAVVLAHAKLALNDRLGETDLPNDPWYDRVFAHYFPEQVVDAARFGLDAHPLRREIITTAIVNSLVNRVGYTSVFRAIEETGASTEQVVRAFEVARAVLGADDLYSTIDDLGDALPSEAQYRACHEIGRVVDRAVRWLLQVGVPIGDIATHVDRFSGVVSTLAPEIRDLVRPAEQKYIQVLGNRLAEDGLPPELAQRTAELLSLVHLFNVATVSDETGYPIEEVAEIYFKLSEIFYIDELLTLISGLPHEDHWMALARGAVRHDVYEALSRIASNVISGTPSEPQTTEARVDLWCSAHRVSVQRTRGVLTSAVEVEPAQLSTLSVALRALRRITSLA